MWRTCSREVCAHGFGAEMLTAYVSFSRLQLHICPSSFDQGLMQAATANSTYTESLNINIMR
jgi:hypothetical protein